MAAPDRSTLGYRPCVGIMLTNKAGQIFAGQRLDFMSEAWQMPQGGIDAGEDAETAALRELAEETGLPANAVNILAQTQSWVTYELPDDLLSKLWGGKYRGQKQMWFLMRLVGDEGLINIKTEIPEFSRWRWMAPDVLLASIVPFKREVYAQVLGELGPKL